MDDDSNEKKSDIEKSVKFDSSKSADEKNDVNTDQNLVQNRQSLNSQPEATNSYNLPKKPKFIGKRSSMGFKR